MTAFFLTAASVYPMWTVLHLPPSIKISGSPTPDLLTLRENVISIHFKPQGNLISVIKMSSPLQELKCLASLQFKFPPFLLAQEAHHTVGKWYEC